MEGEYGVHIMGGVDLDFAKSCAIDKKYDIYITGRTKSKSRISSLGTFQPVYTLTSSLYEAFVVKIDSSGVKQWGTYLGGNNDDFGESVMVDNDFNVFVTGSTRSTSPNFFIGSSGSHKPNPVLWDAFIIKLDSTGNRLWGTCFGGDETDYSTAGAIDNSNNIFITGSTNSPTQIATVGAHDDTPYTSLGPMQDIFLAKFFECEMDSVSVSITSCDEYVSPSLKHTWDSSGLYIDTLHNAKGCDSILLIDLTINYSTHSNINVTKCKSYTSPSGNNTYFKSGFYTDNLINSIGCDSLIRINLTINNVDTSVSRNGIVLSSNQSGGTYQWFDCTNSTVLTSATSRSFSPTANGKYAVITNYNGCTDTSSCHTINGVGINEILTEPEIVIYPNPNSGDFTLDLGKSFSNITVLITNSNGQVVMTKNLIDAVKTSFRIEEGPGIYFLEVLSAKGVEKKFKVIVN